MGVWGMCNEPARATLPPASQWGPGKLGQPWGTGAHYLMVGILMEWADGVAAAWKRGRSREGRVKARIGLAPRAGS